MRFLVTGLNHKTAPVELRERLAIGHESLGETTRALMARTGVKEAMILSTCNRVELLVSHNGLEPSLPEFLAEHFAVERGLLEPHLYRYQDEEAVKHVFRVAASLDSMVVGEAQILGQVKQSWNVARELGAVKGPLDKLLQGAFSAAKRVRTETEIGSSSVSIASVAVDLARRIFGSLEGKKILIVGAGKMSELAARHLMEHGADSIMVANRTFDRAIRLAEQFMGQAIRFEELPGRAHEADIVITSTGAPEKILGVEQAQAILHRRKGQPVFVIDIAVPRDVDPQVNRLEGMFVYDIDDLQQVAAAHLVDRGRETTKAETIIAEETERFRRRIRTIDIAPVLVDVQGTAEELRQAELHRQRVLLQSLSAEQQEAVEALTRGLMNKFMHIPLQAMKAAARDGDAAALETIRGMFEKECGHKVDGGATRGQDETGESNENREPGLKP